MSRYVDAPRALAVVVCVALSGCAPRTAQVRAANMVQVVTRDVELDTDLGPDRARDLAEELQALHDYFHERLFVCARDIELPRVSVFAIENADDAALLFVEGRVGEYQPALSSWSRDAIVVRAPRRGGDALGTFSHELAHRYVGACYPRAPVWLNEGIAELFTTVRFVDDHTAAIGEPAFGFDRARGTVLRSGHLVSVVVEEDVPAFSAVRAMGSAAFYAEQIEGPRRSVVSSLHYAEAWAAAHLLELGDPDLHERFARFLYQLRTSPRSVEELFDEAFVGVDLDARVREYRRRRTFSAPLDPRPPLRDAEARVEAMSPFVAHLRWAERLSSAGRIALAEEHFRAAEAGAVPAELELARARASLSTGRTQEALTLTQRAIERDPSSTEALHAWLALRTVGVARTDEMSERIDRFLAAATTAEELALAARLVSMRGSTDEALLLAQRALSLDPTSWRALAVLGHVYLALGDVPRALRSYEGAVAQGAHAPESELAPARRGLSIAERARTAVAHVAVDAIRGVIHERIDDVRMCWMTSTSGREGRGGRVMVHFEVNAQGAVTAASMAESSLGDPAAETCIVEMFRDWLFDPVGEHVEVSYPITFGD